MKGRVWGLILILMIRLIDYIIIVRIRLIDYITILMITCRLYYIIAYAYAHVCAYA